MPGALKDSSNSQSSNVTTNTQNADPFSPKEWVPIFPNETTQTTFVHLPPSFISSLITGHAYSSQPHPNTMDHEHQHEWSDGTTTIEDNLSDDPSVYDDHHSTIAAINEALSSFNRSSAAVCPKIDTRCPTDATWAHFDRSTRCTTHSDILTLLQASERALAILSPDQSATLSLRLWDESIDPRMEFRMFVLDCNVVAISTRSCNSCSFSDVEAEELTHLFCNWFEGNVKDKFQNHCSIGNYVIDVSVVRRGGPEDRHKSVRLIDFAGWGSNLRTDALLFEWEELEEASWMRVTGCPQFRSMASDASSGGAQSFVRPAQSMYDGIPLELRNGNMMSELVSFAERIVRDHEEVSDSDDQDIDSEDIGN